MIQQINYKDLPEYSFAKEITKDSNSRIKHLRFKIDQWLQANWSCTYQEEYRQLLSNLGQMTESNLKEKYAELVRRTKSVR